MTTYLDNLLILMMFTAFIFAILVFSMAVIWLARHFRDMRKRKRQFENLPYIQKSWRYKK